MTHDPATTAVATATAVTVAITSTSTSTNTNTNGGQRGNASTGRGVVAVATTPSNMGGGGGALSPPLLQSVGSVGSVESVEEHLEGGVLASAGAGAAGVWPSAGAVEFRDVTMCYRPGLPPVLKGLSFEVEVSGP